MKKTLVIIMFVFVSSGITQAQDKGTAMGYTPSSYYTFAWNITFPIGDFHKWVKNPGLAGFDFGGRYAFLKGLYTGYNIGWNRVSEKYSNQTYTIPDQGLAITATNYRTTWMVPFQVVIGKHFMPGHLVSPYVQLGIGGDYMEHHLLIQEYDIYKDRWDFSLSPEIGAIVKFGDYSHWGGFAAFNYKWTTNKIEIYQTETKDLQMLGLKIGLAYIIR